VLLRELRSRNYIGGYTILTDWLRPQREAAYAVAVRRFETARGKQALRAAETRGCRVQPTDSMASGINSKIDSKNIGFCGADDSLERKPWRFC
jgi:hypothetical protein